MNQIVKTTIRWKDDDGYVLGAIYERNLSLPKWGKKALMRDEIVLCINDLLRLASEVSFPPQNFAGHAYKAFKIGNIIQIKSKTDGSFINLRDWELSHFLENRGL